MVGKRGERGSGEKRKGKGIGGGSDGREGRLGETPAPNTLVHNRP